MSQDALITPEEAAKLLRVNTHTVYRALRKGKLPGGKVGKQWRIPLSELEKHLNGGPTSPDRHAG